MLVIASVVNVPVFIFALFLLQTKFRPQMQEDSYYAKYLENQRSFSGEKHEASGPRAAENDVKQTSEKILQELGNAAKGKEEPIQAILRQSHKESLLQRFGDSRSLAELYLRKDDWKYVTQRWSKHPSFIRDIEGLLEEGLVIKKYRGYNHARLTDLGMELARDAEQRNMLFNQKKPDFWEITKDEIESAKRRKSGGTEEEEDEEDDDGRV